jgi:hypothetical protein
MNVLYADCHFVNVIILSIKSIIPRASMLNVVIMSVAIKFIMPSVIMLNVVMMSVTF